MTGTHSNRRLPCLIAVAAPLEASAVLRGAGLDAVPLAKGSVHSVREGVDLVLTGVGKVNAAACVARLLPGGYGAVISVGIGGALPGSGLRVGQSVLASRCAYADEGLVTPQGFTDLGEIGFPLGEFGGRFVPTDSGLRERFEPLVDRVGTVATVSTCSGTDEAAAEIAARTGGLVEAMEGAAVAHVAYESGVPAIEIRVVSNAAGDRARQGWDLEGALGSLSGIIGRVLARL